MLLIEIVSMNNRILQIYINICMYITEFLIEKTDTENPYPIYKLGLISNHPNEKANPAPPLLS